MTKIDDIEIVQIKSKPPIVLVLEALYFGIPVMLGGRKVYLAKTVEGNESPIIEATSVQGDKTEQVALGFDQPLSWFIEEANKLTKDELAILASNIAFNKMRNKYPQESTSV